MITGKRSSGIKLTATFDPFIVVPEPAWRQCKRAILATLELYGFHGTVEDGGGQTEAYERWSKWWREEMRKDEQTTSVVIEAGNDNDIQHVRSGALLGTVKPDAG